MSIDAKVDEVSGVLTQVDQRIDNLREERDMLLTANQQLVTLLDAFEEALKEVEEQHRPAPDLDDDGEEHYEYDFSKGWREREEVHTQNLHLDEPVNADEIKDQLGEIRETLNSISSYKSEEQA